MAIDGGDSLLAKKQKVEAMINPLTLQPYSERYYQLLGKRKKMPAWEARKEFLKLIKRNQIVVLAGETGSGKIALLVQFLLEAGYHMGGCQNRGFACTQPRRVAAMSVARHVADELDVQLATHVGYLIRFEDRTSEETIVKFLTDGMLLREVMTDPLLNKYSVIILDLAHERTLAMDVLFGLVRDVTERRLELKLVVMCATMDVQQMQSYFYDAGLLVIPESEREPERDPFEGSSRIVVQNGQQPRVRCSHRLHNGLQGAIVLYRGFLRSYKGLRALHRPILVGFCRFGLARA